MAEDTGEVVTSGDDSFSITDVSEALGKDLFGTGGEFGNEEEQGNDTGNADVTEGNQTDVPPADDENPTTPDATTETDPNAAPVTTAPRTWRPEAQAEFAKLSPVVQAEVLKREEEMFQGIEMYKADANFGKEIKGVLDPYLPTLEKYNIKPTDQVADMMRAHYTLGFGTPQEKTALLLQVARDYQIDLGQFANYNSGQQDQPYVDPQVADLQKKLDGVQSFITKQQQETFEAKKAEIVQNVAKFANDPVNIYFDELANDITNLIKTGGAKTVEEAYKLAMRSNDAVWQKEQNRIFTERAAAEKAEALKKAAEAKKATSANVKTTQSRGGGTTTPGSMDETLEKTYAKLTGK